MKRKTKNTASNVLKRNANKLLKYLGSIDNTKKRWSNRASTINSQSGVTSIPMIAYLIMAPLIGLVLAMF